MRLEHQVRGTQLIMGEDAKRRRRVINVLMATAAEWGYEEIVLPSLEEAWTYKDHLDNGMRMYGVPNPSGGPELCLRPEGTKTIRELAQHCGQSLHGKGFWYLARCWRHDRPQQGRWREFTQFGIELLGPAEQLNGIVAAHVLCSLAAPSVALRDRSDVPRGLSYYEGPGFEVEAPILGAQKQIAGGGRYPEGIGLAIGVERLALAIKLTEEAV